MPARILVADDHEALRRSLRAIFQASGDDWEICGEAPDGRQAVALATRLRPDLIILDLAMPIMDGLAAARELRKLLPEIPLLMYTMHASPQLEVEARKAGIERIVAKSNSAEILAAARATLREKVGGHDHPAPPAAPASDSSDAPPEKAAVKSGNGNGKINSN